MKIIYPWLAAFPKLEEWSDLVHLGGELANETQLIDDDAYLPHDLVKTGADRQLVDDAAAISHGGDETTNRQMVDDTSLFIEVTKIPEPFVLLGFRKGSIDESHALLLQDKLLEPLDYSKLQGTEMFSANFSSVMIQKIAHEQMKVSCVSTVVYAQFTQPVSYSTSRPWLTTDLQTFPVVYKNDPLWKFVVVRCIALQQKWIHVNSTINTKHTLTNIAKLERNDGALIRIVSSTRV